ncbi:MAG: AarF/UbiB family protein [Pseudomonadota bacterium]
MANDDYLKEDNRLGGRLSRYARVGTGVGGLAAKMAGNRFLGLDIDRDKNAAELASALGNLKGPIMKVAQLIATIPEAVPSEYAAELSQLQSDAPPMGWVFVKRRMRTELGPDWQKRFQEFDREPTAAASLGQVHKAVSPDGAPLACKLQYPDMASAVEADLTQLKLVFSVFRRMDKAIDTSEMAKEIGARVREELQYLREGKHMRLYANLFQDEPLVRVPEYYRELSTDRLLTMGWLEGNKMLTYKEHGEEDRNRLCEAMFKAWWHPFTKVGIIHGDPHLGNYTVFEEDGQPAGINLLDYGCIRIFPPKFAQGVLDLYHGLRTDDRDRVVHAYETWGFRGLTNELIDVMNMWAGFIYGPLLEDRVREIADGVKPGEYGRRQAFMVHKALRENGPVTIPQEFVFMDRAAIGLGGVFLHMRAKLNFYQLFNEQIENFDMAVLQKRQADALQAVELEEMKAA